MQFLKTLFAATALANVAFAWPTHNNTMTFVSQDSEDRRVVFVPNAGQLELGILNVTALSTVTQKFPDGWAGNFYAFTMDQADKTKGMLGEITWNTFAGLTFFDVSAIVAPTDTNNVKQIFPLGSNKPLAGCQDMPCVSGDVYNVWNDDEATKSTLEEQLVCLLGTLETTAATSRRKALVKSVIQAPGSDGKVHV